MFTLKHCSFSENLLDATGQYPSERLYFGLFEQFFKACCDSIILHDSDSMTGGNLSSCSPKMVQPELLSVACDPLSTLSFAKRVVRVACRQVHRLCILVLRRQDMGMKIF